MLSNCLKKFHFSIFSSKNLFFGSFLLCLCMFVSTRESCWGFLLVWRFLQLHSSIPSCCLLNTSSVSPSFFRRMSRYQTVHTSIVGLCDMDVAMSHRLVFGCAALSCTVGPSYGKPPTSANFFGLSSRNWCHIVAPPGQ